MANGGRQVTFANIRVQIAHVTADTSVKEVPVMIPTPFEFLDDVEFFVIGDAMRVRPLNGRSLRCRKRQHRLCRPWFETID